MTQKWQKVSETEYILKPEFVPSNIIATICEGDIPGRYEATITNLTTNKRFSSARPLSLSHTKRMAERMANSPVVQSTDKKLIFRGEW